jgi:hypothetical protein
MRLPLLLSCLLLSAAACDCDDEYYPPPPPPPAPRLVSILVEVYDPVTNFVWENVSVRVVEAYQEWSACICISPYADEYLTDSTGRVLLDEYVLAFAEVGFLLDANGLAVLGSGFDEDQATVLIEVSAEGFVPVYVDVPLTWDQPDVFVEVPFQ